MYVKYDKPYPVNNGYMRQVKVKFHEQLNAKIGFTLNLKVTQARIENVVSFCVLILSSTGNLLIRMISNQCVLGYAPAKCEPTG